jgi:hypothetical protein
MVVSCNWKRDAGFGGGSVMTSPSRLLTDFGRRHFASATFGHAARTRRLVHLADRLAAHPGDTLPTKLPRPADLRAFYRLVNHPAVTHAAALQPHYQQTQELMRQQAAPVLLLQDTTELDYTTLTSLANQLGQIGNGSRRGYLCHHVLAVVAGSRAVLGLAQQILYRRPAADRGESRAARRSKPARESRLWTQASAAVGSAPPGRLWVEVGDRGSDVFEYLDHLHTQGKHYVIRSKHDRHIVRPDGRRQPLQAFARTLPAAGARTIAVPARGGSAVRLQVAWSELTLPPPRNPRGEYGTAPQAAWVVRAWEAEPPAGVEPIEWLLLTNVPVRGAADAWERVDWYATRWLIEELHKGQKTGCGIEQLQFTTPAALEPAIGILSVVAVFLLQLRCASRDEATALRPATEQVPGVYVEVLSRWRHGEGRRDWTVREFFRALARLGGHQNRKGDHAPGWIVLWRGWTKLLTLVEGAEIMIAAKHGQT